MELSSKEFAAALNNDGLELTLSRLSSGTYGSAGDEMYDKAKKWCDNEQVLSSNKDTSEFIRLAKEANKIALDANDLALLANSRASRAESRARAAIYIALATVIIQAWPYIKSIIISM
jgi:hypothetical protein